MRAAHIQRYLTTTLVIFGLTACASIDPRKPTVEMEETKPYVKVTSYTDALSDLGLMTEIYDTPSLKIQSNPIGDNTGSSASTGAEIPRDITEIMKSSLNSIGGKVVYIPYDPSFMQNQVVTGYSNFRNKVIPDVVLTGGITEFDRGLETSSSGTDASVGHEFSGLPEGFILPSKAAELRYSQGSKASMSRITLDFNLLDFQTMTGIPKMNTTNSMEVRKALNENELGVSLFGQSFGGKGSLKKVQGRHAAVRLLVELSMIQMVGKHLMIPYWRLLGEDAKPDKNVLDQIDNFFYSLTRTEVIAILQEWLYIYGYNITPNGKLDLATKDALLKVYPKFDASKDTVDLQTYRHVYLNVPINVLAKKRRAALKAL